MATYLPTTSAKDANNQCEAIGRAYAAKVGKPWPMPPDSYGPGRQPFPPAAYYQKLYVTPVPDPGIAPPALDTPDTRALKVPVDAVVQTLVITGVVVTDGSTVSVNPSKAVAIVPPAPVVVAAPVVAVKVL